MDVDSCGNGRISKLKRKPPPISTVALIHDRNERRQVSRADAQSLVVGALLFGTGYLRCQSVHNTANWIFQSAPQPGAVLCSSLNHLLHGIPTPRGNGGFLPPQKRQLTLAETSTHAPSPAGFGRGIFPLSQSEKESVSCGVLSKKISKPGCSLGAVQGKWLRTPPATASTVASTDAPVQESNCDW
jgi:hypothetical protein